MRPFIFSVLFFLLLHDLSLAADKKVLPPDFVITQDLYARFSTFNPDQKKLPIGTVSAVIQDRTGFIWLGGDEGLGRFDGYEFKIYKPDTSLHSLPGAIVSSFVLDPNGSLWIGTSGGLCTYREESDDFITVFGDTANILAPPDSLYVREMFLDGDSLIWFATVNGALLSYSLSSNRIQTEAMHSPIAQPYYRYHAVVRLNDTALIVGGRGRGPFLFSTKTHLFHMLRVHPQELDGAKREYDLSMAKRENDSLVWIGGLEGLYLYDLHRNYFYKYYSGTVYALITDRNGHYWLGTGDGAIEIDPQSGSANRYLHSVNDPGSLGGERIYNIYEDRSGRIWLAHENGVSTYLPPKPGVRYLFHIPGEENTPASSRITALAPAKDGQIWIGTADKGLDLFNPGTNHFTHFTPENNPDIISVHVKALKVDSKLNLYIGYWAGLGFGRFNNQNNRFEKYRFNQKGLTQDWYNDFEFTADDRVYLGFWGGPGLTIFDPAKKQYDSSPALSLTDAYDARLINCLKKDRQNRLWIGTTNSGIHLWDEQSQTGDQWVAPDLPGFGMYGQVIYDLAQDAQGNIYAGSNGLFKFDGTKQFQPVALRSGFETMEVYQILPMDENSIWLLSSKGLLKYNPQTGWINDFSMLVNIEFKAGQAAALKLPDGKLILGGSTGIAIIQPDMLGMQHAFPKVFLTHLDVNNKLLIPFLGNQRTVKLSHDQNFFTIHIGTDRWEKDQPYTYYYKMDGFEDTWVKLASGQRSANFTNVPAGDFTFRMRTGDAYGNMGEQEATLALQISKPWWKKGWFIFIVIFSALGIAVSLWRIRLKDIKLQVQNMELSQKLLRLQMNPHFIFNSLTSIQNYIYSNQTHLAGQYLSDFAKLIRLILENSRHEYISLEKEVETISLYMELQLLRFPKGFDFQLHLDPALDPEITFVPPMLAQPFLENALEHGLSQKTGGGLIAVSYKLVDKKIRFEVRDNGVGLTATVGKPKDTYLNKESLSTAICKERLQILEHKFKRKIPLVIEEIIGKQGIEGTRVVFDLPLETNYRHKKS